MSFMDQQLFKFEICFSSLEISLEIKPHAVLFFFFFLSHFPKHKALSFSHTAQVAKAAKISSPCPPAGLCAE